MVSSTRRSRARLLPVLFALAATGCGEQTPRAQFEDDVVPILEQNCLGSTCHGVFPRAEADGDVIDWDFFHVRVNGDGTVASYDQAYDAAKSSINTVEHGAFSTLLRKPLSNDAGGLVHLGGVQFANRQSASYRAVAEWIAAEVDGGEGEDTGELTALERQFATDVLPHLQTLQCMNASCHGAFAPFTHFDAPIDVDGELQFSVEATRANYRAARMHLYLGGDVTRSRLLVKSLPIGHGGVVHRGGNAIFFGDIRSGPSQGLLDWARAEQRSEMQGASTDIRGIVFVRGPVRASPTFEHDEYVPGTDLFILEPPEPGGTLRNLTAAAHPGGPADVRDPSVRHDAMRIAFAMRRGEADAFNIYDIAVDGSDLRQHTSDEAALPGGGRLSNVQPTYGPDGRIFFTSTRAGSLADGQDVLDTDIWAVDPSGGRLERLTHDPSPEVTPSFIGQGKNYGTLAFTMRRTIGGRFQAPVLRMPLDHNKAFHGDPEIHIHHGVTLDGEVVYDMRTLPDGRFSCVLLGRGNVWRGGKLAVFDRQLGPLIEAGREAEAGVGGYRRAFSTLSTEVASSGPSPGGLFRHPVPLPSGELLVSRAVEAIDLDDADSSPDLGLYLVHVEESLDGGQAQIGQIELLLDDPDIAEYDAEPIVARPLEDDPSHAHSWDSTYSSTTGVVAFRHVETLEAIASNLSQAGPKVLRDDLAHLRLIESLPVGPDEHAEAPIGLGVHGRTRVLAEVALRGGSAYLEVPADTPFRVQYLNADRMAVGTQPNRWLHVAPGEKFPVGVAPELYPVLCAGCHGELSGHRADVGGPVPDVITSSSVTLATHEGMNPRRPLAPEPVGREPITVDFRRDIASVLERSCTAKACHAGEAPAGGLSLAPTPTEHFDAAYEALLAKGSGSGGGGEYVDGRGSSARRSHLIERIYGRELDAPRELTGSCEGNPPLSDEERMQLVRWIELGAVYRGMAP